MRRGIAIMSLVGLFVVVMVAAAVQGTPTIEPFDTQPINDSPPVIPLPTSTPSGTPTPQPINDVMTAVIGMVLLILGAVILLALGVVLVRALIRAWLNRPLAIRSGDEVAYELSAQDVPQDEEAAAPVIRRGIEGALRAVDERPQPTDAIIAAWVGLEESAADANLTRGVSETPSEFTLRIITRRAGIGSAAQELLELYERVRFGGHVADEDDRTVARRALRAIEEGWR
ncbi:DUF4129 domain-containing protein [Microbacterium sp. A196]|uniref:DUF4129 domain-containing protein n=1 Tax=unclassified Microbacterium TaxID=2609290 RepID=UPI003FD4DE56